MYGAKDRDNIPKGFRLGVFLFDPSLPSLTHLLSPRASASLCDWNYSWLAFIFTPTRKFSYLKCSAGRKHLRRTRYIYTRDVSVPRKDASLVYILDHNLFWVEWSPVSYTIKVQRHFAGGSTKLDYVVPSHLVHISIIQIKIMYLCNIVHVYMVPYIYTHRYYGTKKL